MNVNVGCGANPIAGWVNIDNSPVVAVAALAPIIPLLSDQQRDFARIAKRHGVRYGSATALPLQSGSVSVLYSSHMMEHLDQAEARAFLKEAHRSIKPGGFIRLALPDLRRRAESYIEDGDADAFVGATLLGAERPRRLAEWIRHIVTGARHHLWMYDGPSLVGRLEEAGFMEAKIQPAGQTMIPEATLDLHEREEESVYVEARKAF